MVESLCSSGRPLDVVIGSQLDVEAVIVRSGDESLEALTRMPEKLG